jgi:hypothetical protein
MSSTELEVTLITYEADHPKKKVMLGMFFDSQGVNHQEFILEKCNISKFM